MDRPHPRLVLQCTGSACAGQCQEPLPGGEVKVIRVEELWTVGEVHLTFDELKANRRVLLGP